MPANLQRPPVERAAPLPPQMSSHPADSARIFMSLLALARQAGDPDEPLPTVGGYQQLVAPPVLRSLLSAAHFRDEATVFHLRRVALISVGIARELGWEPTDIRMLEIASLLHDIGKIGVPDTILRKPGKLSPDEAEVVAVHHNVGLAVLQACRVHISVVEMIARASRVPAGAHHIDAKALAVIQHGAKILAVADVYDSLSRDQVYRRHIPHPQVMTALSESERQLDRNVIAGLRRWLESGGLATLSDDRQAAESIRASAPIDAATMAQANSLCHAFSYLYLLESLYDAYYVVDPDLRMVICSRGVNTLFPDVKFQPGETWSRRMIPAIDEIGQPLADSAYPLHKVIEANQPQCATLKLTATSGDRLEVECHAIPLIDDEGRLHGAAEILRNVSQSKRNPTLYNELRQAANQDPLTGVANRGQLENRLAELFTDYMQGGGKEPFSVIFLDLDHFKRVNDTYDHATGDHVLITIARLLEDELYSGETVGRYGGEEFLILCPATTLEQAVKRAERVRRTVQDALFGEEPHFHVTASLGVAQAVAEDTMDSVVQRADQALFDAKRSGRNRTCFREPEDVVAPNTHTEAVKRVHRHGEYVHTTQFVACQAADMLVFKLKGFVEDHKAQLLDVRNNLVAMQMGRKSWRGKWGDDPEKQPVEMIVSVGEREVERKSATRRVALDVTVTPLGKPQDGDAFHNRATRVVELLRSYLLAD